MSFGKEICRMFVSFRMWLKDVPFTDPLRREQAVLLQAFLFILTAAALLGALAPLTAISASDRLIGVSTSLLLGLLLIGAVVVLRRGHFTPAVALVIVGMIAMVVVNMLPTGLEGSRAIFTLLALPIVLAGLLGGRRILMLAFVLSVLAVVGVTVLEVAAPTLVGYSDQTYDPVLTCVTFVVAAGVLALLVGRFGQALQRALWQARSREQELDALRISLEQQVGERTADRCAGYRAHEGVDRECVGRDRAHGRALRYFRYHGCAGGGYACRPSAAGHGRSRSALGDQRRTRRGAPRGGPDDYCARHRLRDHRHVSNLAGGRRGATGAA